MLFSDICKYLSDNKVGIKIKNTDEFYMLMGLCHSKNFVWDAAGKPFDSEVELHNSVIWFYNDTKHITHGWYDNKVMYKNKGGVIKFNDMIKIFNDVCNIKDVVFKYNFEENPLEKFCDKDLLKEICRRGLLK